MSRRAIILLACTLFGTCFAIGLRAIPAPAAPDPVVTVDVSTPSVTYVTAKFRPRIGLPATEEYFHTFELQNDGADPLVIESSAASCGCLAKDIDRLEIAPTQSARIRLGVKASNIIGRSVSLTVHTSRGTRYVYTLGTHTYPPVMLASGTGSPIVIGSIPAATATTIRRQLFVHSYAPLDPPQLQPVHAENQGAAVYTLTDRGVESLAGGALRRRVCDLEIEVPASTTPGLHTVDVTLVGCSSAPQSAIAYELPTRLVWTVANPVRINPPRWIVANTATDMREKVTQTFRVESIDDSPFTVQRIATSHDALTATAASAEGASAHDVEMQLDLSQLPETRPFLASVTMDLGFPSHPQRVQPVETFHVVIAR